MSLHLSLDLGAKVGRQADSHLVSCSPRSQLFGEDDETTDQEELNKAAEDGENGAYFRQTRRGSFSAELVALSLGLQLARSRTSRRRLLRSGMFERPWARREVPDGCSKRCVVWLTGTSRTSLTDLSRSRRSSRRTSNACFA